MFILYPLNDWKANLFEKITVLEFIKALNRESLSKINTQLSQGNEIQLFIIIR